MSGSGEFRLGPGAFYAGPGGSAARSEGFPLDPRGAVRGGGEGCAIELHVGTLFKISYTPSETDKRLYCTTRKDSSKMCTACLLPWGFPLGPEGAVQGCAIQFPC